VKLAKQELSTLVASSAPTKVKTLIKLNYDVLFTILMKSAQVEYLKKLTLASGCILCVPCTFREWHLVKWTNCQM
jgi:hypothetical protein